ncbi:hypothetical protein Tco_1199832 [Tanacetum coccineum]
MERSKSWSLRVRAEATLVSSNDKDDRVTIFVKKGKDGERLDIRTLTYKLSQFVLDLVYTEYDAEVEFSHDAKKLSVIFHGHIDQTLSVQDVCMHPSAAQWSYRSDLVRARPHYVKERATHILNERTVGAPGGFSIKKASNKQIPSTSSSVGTVFPDTNFRDPSGGSKKRKQSRPQVNESDKERGILVIAKKSKKNKTSKEDKMETNENKEESVEEGLEDMEKKVKRDGESEILSNEASFTDLLLSE